MKDRRDGVEFMLSDEAKAEMNAKPKKKASKGVHKKPRNTKKLTTEEIRLQRERRLQSFETEVEYIKPYDDKSDKSFIVYAILVGIIISIIAFYLVFSVANEKMSVENNANNNQNNSNQEVIEPQINDKHELEDALIAEYKTVRGYINNIDKEYKIIEVLDISNGEPIQIVVSSATHITDQFGRALVFAELELGDGILVEYVRANNVAINIEKPDEFFVKSNKTAVKTDIVSNAIEYNNNKYYLTEYTIILDKDGNYTTLSEISDKDYITFKGLSNYVNYIKVDKGHGTIKFTNVEKVKNPTVYINTRTIVDPNKKSQVVVGEGAYEVLVTGDNITPYTMEIENIDNGQEVEVDFKFATDKLGHVGVVSNVENIVLKINDKEYDEESIITLPYGEYTVSATKLNYTEEVQVMVIDKPKTNLVINLVPIATDVVVDIATIPAEAELYVDNQLVGITPIKTSITKGQHQITIKYPGKHDISFDIDGTDKYYKYNFTLMDKPTESE